VSGRYTWSHTAHEIAPATLNAHELVALALDAAAEAVEIHPASHWAVVHVLRSILGTEGLDAEEALRNQLVERREG
jgi:hypothetical protein